MNKPILAVIDIQKEYVTKGRPFYINGIESSLGNAKKVLEYARAQDWQVVHVQHLQAGDLFSTYSDYSDFVDGFEPLSSELVFQKSDYSSYSSDLFLSFVRMNSSSEIYVIGYGSTMCCLSTIIDGYHRGFKHVFVHDASQAKASSQHSEVALHEHATDILGRYCKVVSTAELLKPRDNHPQ